MRFIRPDFELNLHKYTNPATGAAFTGVTSVLRAVGLYKDLAWLDKKYRQRGSAVHLGTLALVKGESLAATMVCFAPEIHPFLSAFAECYRASRCRALIEHCEVAIADAAMGYAGTPDLLMERPDKSLELVDVKSGQHVDLVGLQLGAYRTLIEGFTGLKIQHCSEWNLRDGKCAVSHYSEPLWKARWSGVITTWAVGREYGRW